MERLDFSVAEKTKMQVILNCGYDCAKKNHKVIERALGRRKKYASTDEFLAAEKKTQ
jgi:hypothetical protein